MIAVIADDFTGAAELAGISLRYGLNVNLYQGDIIAASTDVEIICTDSRSMQGVAHITATADAVNTLLSHEPAFIFKKIDSVLRGYVVEELKVQMELTQKNKAIILPANPSLGRTIVNGEYFIGDKKITATGFVNDPEFPVRSAQVLQMINDDEVILAKHTDALPETGIVIGEAATMDDITAWANKIDESWIMVGAGDFYTALLNKLYQPKPQPPLQLLSPHLYVCGTAFDERRAWIQQLAAATGLVTYLPDTADSEWVDAVCDSIRKNKKLVLAIDDSADDAVTLRTKMARAVRKINEKENIREIFIEGGSTAAAVLNAFNIKMMVPVNELQRGVVRMKAKDKFITVKPGSYQLPEEIIKLYS